MKLTKSSLKEMIREVIREEKQLNEDIGFKPDSSIEGNYMDYASPKRDTSGGLKMFYQKYSSPEAKKVVEGRLKEIIKEELNEAVSPSAVIMKHKKDIGGLINKVKGTIKSKNDKDAAKMLMRSINFIYDVDV